MTKRIPKDILEREVIGLNLAGRTLAGQLTAPVNLLVFLRHFGCVFCREMVADVRNAATQEANYPNVVFFYQGTVEQGQDFLPTSGRKPAPSATHRWCSTKHWALNVAGCARCSAPKCGPVGCAPWARDTSSVCRLAIRLLCPALSWCPRPVTFSGNTTSGMPAIILTGRQSYLLLPSRRHDAPDNHCRSRKRRRRFPFCTGGAVFQKPLRSALQP